MSITKEKLVARKEQIKKDFDETPLFVVLSKIKNSPKINPKPKNKIPPQSKIKE